MEGTLEDSPLVKDPSNDNSDVAKDAVILNGVNGSCDDSDKLDNDMAPDSKMVTTDNALEEDDEEEEEDVPDNEDIPHEKTLNSSQNKNLCDNDSKNSTKEPISTEDSKSAESDNKNVSEVLDDKRECKDNFSESMDVDYQNNNSDVECLDENITDLQMEVDTEPDKNQDDDINDDDDDDEDDDDDDDDVKAVSESSDIQHLNDSVVSISSAETSDLKICEENGSLSSPEIEEITESKSNGHNISEERLSKEPKQKKARKQIDLSNITPRRSSRNIKRTSYIEKEPEEVEVDGSSDIEEIKPEDPLACVDSKDKENSKLKSPIKTSKTTIVVNDTKRLVEIAAGSKASKGGKKEPTLVIIDTNSILSGRGGVPINNSKSHHSVSSSSGFSVMPVGLNATQTIYPNMRTTITPVPMTSKTAQLSPKLSSSITAIPTPAPAPQILPTLTDDMFVVEAPSFIVPYVYEKPPLKPLKEFVTKLEKCIEEIDKEEKSMKKDKKNRKNKDDSSESSRNDSESEGSVKSMKKDDYGDSVDLADKQFGGDDKDDKNKILTYFDLPLGKFFMQIGVNLVQEFVQTDLLRTQKRKQGKGSTSAETQMAINSLIKNLEFSKENNEPFHLEMKKCEFCNFKTESALVMQHHLETPHMRNYVYKCNFCPLEVRSPHDILFHMEAEHNTRGRLERGPAFHQCPNCPFEDNQKGKLTRHILACTKKFRPERNLEPATDWEPPAKIPRFSRARNVGSVNSNALAMAMGSKGPQPLLPKLLPTPITGRGRGRPPMQPRYSDIKSLRPGSTPVRQDNVPGMMYRPTSSGLLVPTSYQFGSNQIFQVVGGSGTVTSASGVSSSSCGSSGRPTPIALVSNVIDSQSRLSSLQNTSSSSKNPAAKLLSQPSISITPLPRTTSQAPILGSGSPSKPGGKNTFVICEICDGYIKDLEQLRNHMQWIHKVKIHPKMIYNRPPLNCQKCQFRFFTDQGLERHLLGSHGLVTSSMQEAANKGKDAGRCPACGRVYQWKLLNHVARDHGMTLKPAHLSYKCTVCTATFGMYKQFENHVYSAHSVVAKRVIDKKNTPSSPSSRSNDSLLKPLKINDEITIIPQPAKTTTRLNSSQGRSK
ncbi:MOG interacting and ectopic P-granules protein 1 isoform X2 [Chelonus insularis]|nr:MOG interacting and ectopic P-granules protein 1 isoform X2 [Chelonus insularis]XP_034940256.1 MOG interacting and ectopic P-granules protein 1 isoform X2 [Chelonus insularis]XP_034940257.1 MOG interacting and ectopic P-granules protein 1 isoform X2 [Chelonus insularis]XP_034940258.1 MOG interacting and ectopic P-granules protein 1 isoform X2 [Chelonus insularis]XP_034940260.1 MOG interacting and ectopic P-granules protein 1 isoform X2 [Chelonus insularis]XP_034940261.1 MOG interacting and 